jgi:hypothetical protein
MMTRPVNKLAASVNGGFACDCYLSWTMNKLLAETLSILNGFVALTTIISCGVLGKYLGPYGVQLYAQLNNQIYAGSQSQAEAVGVILGLAIGFIWAVIFHGLLALFIQVHRELKAIRRQLIDTKPLQAPTSQARAEPRMPVLAVGGLGK